MTYYNDRHAAPHADGFIALAVAEDAAVAVGELMQGLPASLRCFQDQAVRAAASVALNVAEGSGRRGRERKRFYQVAHASAREAKSAVRIVVRLNAIDQAPRIPFGIRSAPDPLRDPVGEPASQNRLQCAGLQRRRWGTAAMGHGGEGARR